MDPQELQDWRDFCEGRKPNFESENMFMELFSQPLTKADRDDLRTIFSYVPNSSRALKKMFRMDSHADDKTEAQIVKLVHRDLKEKRRIIKDPEVLAAMDLGVREIVAPSRFDEVFQASLNGQFIHDVCDYEIEPFGNANIAYALVGTFYYLANNLHLQTALKADLFNAEVSFDNYFELYLIAVNYAVDPTGVLVVNHRASMRKVARSWRTSTVTKLAKAIFAENAFDRMPVLGDALEEAGCTRLDVLEHCRGGLPHAPGCWVIDLLLGKR